MVMRPGGAGGAASNRGRAWPPPLSLSAACLGVILRLTTRVLEVARPFLGSASLRRRGGRLALAASSSARTRRSSSLTGRPSAGPGPRPGSRPSRRLSSRRGARPSGLGAPGALLGRHRQRCRAARLGLRPWPPRPRRRPRAPTGVGCAGRPGWPARPESGRCSAGAGSGSSSVRRRRGTAPRRGGSPARRRG